MSWQIDLWAAYLDDRQLRAVYDEAARWMYDNDTALHDMPLIAAAMVDHMEYDPDNPEDGPSLDDVAHTIMWEAALRWIVAQDRAVTA
jgi:hypothetical protein